MLNSFLFAAGAVLPIVLLTLIGYLAKCAGILPEGVTKHLNRLVFRILLPCNLFLNVYGMTGFSDVKLGYILFVLIAAPVLLALALPAILASTRDPARRGALSQAVFRSNYALVGIPLAEAIGGEEGAVLATLLSAALIPLFNVMAVICLSVFGGGKVSPKRIALGVLKNPLIISIAAGCLCLGVRAIFAEVGIGLRLSSITPIYSMLTQLGKTATPIALLTLGAQFSFSAVPALRQQIILGTLLRTVAVPTVALTVAYCMGCFEGAHFATFVAAFATPVAVSSVPMAQEMGADTRLAGQLVVFSTLVSGLTIFIYSFLLRLIGVF